MKENIYSKIYQELNLLLIWIEGKNKEEIFDFDILYESLFDEYGIDMNYGFLYPIYSIVDLLCDSLRHDQKNIIPGYSVEKGIKDLKFIISRLDRKEYDKLERNINLKNKILKLYD